LEIASMLACGATAEAISTATALDVDGVERHLTTCCTTNAVDDAPDTLERSDQRLKVLAEKISAAGTGAGLAGDAKTLLTALSVGLRLEMEVRKRLEAKQEQLGRDLPHDIDRWTDAEAEKMRAYMDRVVLDAGHTSYASTTAKMMAMEVELERRADALQVVGLFQRLLKDPALLATVQAMTKEAA
jgi:hypothetical protein